MNYHKPMQCSGSRYDSVSTLNLPALWSDRRQINPGYKTCFVSATDKIYYPSRNYL